MDKGFLKTYGKSKPKEIRLVPHSDGFLRLTYDDIGDLLDIGYVKDKKGKPIGAVLEIDRDLRLATYIEPMGVSGLQWNDGEAYWGNTYDDSITNSREISLDDWVDEIVSKMDGK